MASRVESRAVSVISEDGISIKKSNEEDDGSESICNTKSRTALAGCHKKKLHPLLLGPSRRDQGKYVPMYTASKNNLSEFTQRIMSAKLLRVKQVQNQLSETQIQLNELINENRILKNLQKRQEGALRKYEGNHAELPQLIRSHNEEIRALKASNKLIKTQLKESNVKLKERENELEALRDSHNKLKKLCSEKNLLEREKLQKKVDELQDIVKEQDEKIQVLSRKILLESKSYRHHLNVEMNKHKETQKELNNALNMISRMENQAMIKDKTNWVSGGFGKTPLKRDSKPLLQSFSNKSLTQQSRLNQFDHTSRDESVKSKNEMSETPETEFELLNALISSDNTPSPLQDILPEVNSLKKDSPEVPFVRSDIDITKLTDPIILKNAVKSGGTSKRLSKTASDVETTAKGVAEKLSKNLEFIDNLGKGDYAKTNSKARLNSLYEELKTKIEDKVKNKSDDEGSETREENETGSLRRNVTKRKLNDEKAPEITKEESEELSPSHQQKFITMTKTWNEIKDKIQEERLKAERKMREFDVTEKCVEINSGSSQSLWKVDKKDEENDDEDEKSPPIEELLTQRQPKQMPKLADDNFILGELEKTDKAFKKLKDGGKVKKIQKSTQENCSFRTESQAAPKYLDEFQSEYQKQNLLKALKAIDVGRDGNSSSEEQENSPREADGYVKAADFRARMPAPSLASKTSKNDLLNELFGAKRIEKGSRQSLEYGCLEGIKARNNR